MSVKNVIFNWIEMVYKLHAGSVATINYWNLLLLLLLKRSVFIHNFLYFH